MHYDASRLAFDVGDVERYELGPPQRGRKPQQDQRTVALAHQGVRDAREHPV